MVAKAYIGSSAYDPSVKPRVPLPAELTEGHVLGLGGLQAVLNGDSATTTIDCGRVPSNARILRKSDILADAIAGNTALKVGLGRRIGGVLTVDDDDCLLAANDIHAGGVVNLTGISAAKFGQTAWQLAGLADDPGGEMHVVVTLGADLTAGGNIAWDILFKTP